jgi:hypothetical protein
VHKIRVELKVLICENNKFITFSVFSSSRPEVGSSAKITVG